jgi:hypothetical protein
MRGVPAGVAPKTRLQRAGSRVEARRANPGGWHGDGSWPWCRLGDPCPFGLAGFARRFGWTATQRVAAVLGPKAWPPQAASRLEVRQTCPGGPCRDGSWPWCRRGDACRFGRAGIARWIDWTAMQRVPAVLGPKGRPPQAASRLEVRQTCPGGRHGDGSWPWCRLGDPCPFGLADFARRIGWAATQRVPAVLGPKARPPQAVSRPEARQACPGGPCRDGSLPWCRRGDACRFGWVGFVWWIDWTATPGVPAARAPKAWPPQAGSRLEVRQTCSGGLCGGGSWPWCRRGDACRFGWVGFVWWIDWTATLGVPAGLAPKARPQRAGSRLEAQQTSPAGRCEDGSLPWCRPGDPCRFGWIGFARWIDWTATQRVPAGLAPKARPQRAGSCLEAQRTCPAGRCGDGSLP